MNVLYKVYSESLGEQTKEKENKLFEGIVFPWRRLIKKTLPQHPTDGGFEMFNVFKLNF